MLSLNANEHAWRERMTMTVRSLIWRAVPLAALLLVAAQPAQAQIVALVNGEPITALDIAQRTKLIQLSTQKTPTRQEVLDELIDDKLKVHIGKRYISEVPKREIESAYTNIARRAGMIVRAVRQNDHGKRSERRSAEGAHPCRFRLVADHSRQVPSRACRSARRKSP